jgi:peptidoglycan hydrolase-like protein with peptidoglycan-binding domain
LKKTKTRKAPVRSVKLSKTKRSPAKTSRSRSKTKKKGLLVRLGLKTEYEYKKLHVGVALIFLGGLVAGLIIGVNHFTSAAGSGNLYACPAYPVLQVGSTGDCVRRVQWYELNKANCSSCAITGVFDANLKTAVTAFQAFNGIPAIGYVNDQTWATYNVFEGATADKNALLPGTIDGSRVDAAGKLATWGTVTVDGVSKANNPFSFTNEAHGRHWISAEASAGHRVVGYSYCINGANCVATINSTSGPVDVPGNGKITVTWHYITDSTAKATTPVAAPGTTVANNIKDHTCLIPGTSSTQPCTLDQYNQQQAFLTVAKAATTCIRADLSTYTCSTAEHDTQAAAIKSMTTCIRPGPVYVTCSVDEHNKEAALFAALAAPKPRAETRPPAATSGSGSSSGGGSPGSHGSGDYSPPPPTGGIPDWPGYHPGSGWCEPFYQASATDFRDAYNESGQSHLMTYLECYNIGKTVYLRGADGNVYATRTIHHIDWDRTHIWFR